MADKKFRLVTRPDFDGVVCGALLMELEMIGDVAFAHPADMQGGRVPIGPDDVTTNLPYVPEVHLCFDHHVSEIERVGAQANLIIDPTSPSAARVVYDYYGGEHRFPNISEELMAAVDKADSAQFTESEVLAPEDWVLLNFVLDGRTGLNALSKFTLPNEQLMFELMTYCRHNPIEEILALPDILERVNAYRYHKEFAERQLVERSRIVDKTVVTDFRDLDKVFAVNRFLIYAIYPNTNLSATLRPAPRSGYVEIAIGKSIFDRSSSINVGSMLLAYGGGGHAAAGTCQVPAAKADETLDKILSQVAVEAA